MIASISTVAPSGIAAIPPVAFRLLTTIGSATEASSTIDRVSSLVDLSGTGQLLSAVAATESRLTVLQATPDDAEAAGVVATAQGFVETFNELQDSVAGLQSLFDLLPDTSPVAPLAPTVSDLAATALEVASANFDSLLEIGITVQAATPPASGATLSIDQDVLGAASAADPAGTLAVLDQAIGELAEQLNDFEGQAASAALAQATLTQANLLQAGSTTGQAIEAAALLGLPATSPVPGAALTTDLLQALPADTVLNDIQLTDLDLAATGVDATTLLTEPDVLQGTPAADLLATIDIAELAEEILTTAAAEDLLTATTANPAATAATLPAINQPATDQVPVNPLVTPTGTASTVAVPAVDTGLASSVTDAMADALAADRRASEATLALQNLLANTADRTAAILVDPVYAALVASVRLNELVPPTPLIDPAKLAAEYPGPVMAAVRDHAVEENI